MTPDVQSSQNCQTSTLFATANRSGACHAAVAIVEPEAYIGVAMISTFPRLIFLVLSVLLTVSCASEGPAPTPTPLPPLNDSIDVRFDDAGLDAAVRKALDKQPDDTISSEELSTLTTLNALLREVTDIRGVEHLTNLLN